MNGPEILSISYTYCLTESEHVMRIFKEDENYVFMTHLGNFTLKTYNSKSFPDILMLRVEELNEYFGLSLYYLRREYFFQFYLKSDMDKLLKFLKIHAYGN